MTGNGPGRRSLEALADRLAGSPGLGHLFHLIAGGLCFGVPFVALASVAATYAGDAAGGLAFPVGTPVMAGLVTALCVLGPPAAAGIAASRWIGRRLAVQDRRNG